MRNLGPARVASPRGRPGRPQPGVAALVVSRTGEAARALAGALGEQEPLIEIAASLEAADELRRRLRFDLVVVEQEQVDAQVADWVAERRRAGDCTPVILLVDAAGREEILSALRAGISDLLTGAGRLGDLADAVRRLLGPAAERGDGPRAVAAGDGIFDTEGIVGESRTMIDLSEVVRRIAPMPATVLIEGESGTGKELVARAIHRLSGRAGHFAAINCGAITAELFESELFGHTKGAFTGALQARDGLFAYAEGGTIFLDEIGEMPLAMQAKLLRVLEERTIRPVGSNREQPVDVRVIAATNAELQTKVSGGEFREDLFHRINVISLRVPPLRERPEDIPVLARYFMHRVGSKMGIAVPEIRESEWLRLRQYSWPGNVRELRNVVERCALLDQRPSACLGGVATGEVPEDAAGDDLTLASFERQHIRAVLRLSGGNKSKAARRLGISRKTLERKLRRCESAAAAEAPASRRRAVAAAS
jgi:two-component system NtrC family response regulator